MDIDDIVDVTGLPAHAVQLALAQLINAGLTFYKQRCGYCKYAIQPANLQLKTVALTLVFAVIPCK